MKDGYPYFLSDKFFQDYPHSKYPEIEMKRSRPYIYYVIPTDCGFDFAIPLRSNVNHKYCFRTIGNKGLDFSKAIPILNPDYVDVTKRANVDSKEFHIIRDNKHRIKVGMDRYIKKYFKAKGKMHIRENKSLVEKSTLQYFESVLGIE